MDIKQFIRDYYNSILDPEAIKNFLHPKVDIQWYSLRGFIEISKDEFIGLAEQLNKRYSNSRFEISHIIAEGQQVSIRYAHLVRTLENPDIETVLSHTNAIWELKDNKLFKGYIMTHLD